MALAEAILRQLHENKKGKVLFSTHYHELTVLDKQLERLKNVHVGAIEKNGELVFLHKIMNGPADKSYGLHVAKLAGMPNSLIKDAKIILRKLENDRKNESTSEVLQETEQLALFNEPEMGMNQKQVLKEMEELALEQSTPMELMNAVYEWKQLLSRDK